MSSIKQIIRVGRVFGARKMDDDLRAARDRNIAHMRQRREEREAKAARKHRAADNAAREAFNARNNFEV